MWYIPFLRVFDKCVNQQTVCFWMYILHGYLKAIETSGLCDLYLLTKPLNL